MNGWPNSWQQGWYQQSHPHVYMPPQAQAQQFAQQAPPGYWETPGWNAAAAQQQHDSFRSREYPDLNPVLASDSTLLRYDIRNKPRETILATTYFSTCQTPALATPCSHMRLISKSFPWTIEIKPTQSSITCELVWDSIYFALQEPLADSEWGLVVTDKSTREMVEKAARKRQDKDKDRKLKRIDLLGDTTLFKGLEKDNDFEKMRLLPRAKGCSETWVVKLSSGL